MSEYQAKYSNQVVLDYKGNPLIEALPGIWSSDEVVDLLTNNEGHHDGERTLDVQYRFHCVQRLFHYYQPLEQQIDIEQRFSRCIRQGYLHRNPLSAEYVKSLTQGHRGLKEQKSYKSLEAFRPTAAGFTIIGLSGVGKTSAVTNVLNLYPQVIVHTRYKEKTLVLKQVVWLKLDCPHDGSVKGLCMGFFEAIDRVAGTNYFENCFRSTIDVLMIRMAQAARLHCLGVLVIDEIQHLSLAKGGGSEKMLNFFVTLVNTIGVPVVMIGTSKAMSVLQSEFRQARRGSGQGDLIWERMKKDAAWNIFVSSMWDNQWTKQIVPLTDAFNDALYYESQGIIDVAIKLYAMVQIRAIALGTETFLPSDLSVAASEKLGLIKPMLDALRSGDKKKINVYADIASVSIDDYYSACSTALDRSLNMKTNKTSLAEKSMLKLLELGVEPQKAKYLTGKIIATHQDAKTVADVVRAAYQLYLSDTDKAVADSLQSGDLRNAAGYEELKKNGIIGSEEW